MAIISTTGQTTQIPCMDFRNRELSFLYILNYKIYLKNRQMEISAFLIQNRLNPKSCGNVYLQQ